MSTEAPVHYWECPHPHCGVQFQSYNSYYGHMKYKHRPPIVGNACVECGNRFATQEQHDNELNHRWDCTHIEDRMLEQHRCWQCSPYVEDEEEEDQEGSMDCMWEGGIRLHMLRRRELLLQSSQGLAWLTPLKH